MIVLLHATKNVAEELRRYGWHFGYYVDEETGLDRGLIDIFKSDDYEDCAERMAYWITELQQEVEQIQDGVVVIRHPNATIDVLRHATDSPVVEISAKTASEAIERLENLTQREHASLL